MRSLSPYTHEPDERPAGSHADSPDPTAFWASKVLLTAVEFDSLGPRRAEMTAIELGDALGLHPVAPTDFFDALVAMGFLERNGDGGAGRYRKYALTGSSSTSAAPATRGFPQMLNSRLFGFWNGPWRRAQERPTTERGEAHRPHQCSRNGNGGLGEAREFLLD